MHTDVINAFVAKLKLRSQRANNDNFASFHRLTDITEDDFEQNLKEDIISHLQNLQNEFERYCGGAEIKDTDTDTDFPR